ncbi:MAG TPA: selenocysteine-specific translation elongation factor [Thermodesulfobacteriota bacterium]|nr:selenocysteine-specific translation elongation factor [Deltaproteobacteria bacterium]HNR13642.1 selenocysteine-specific translation elongation factor [Thermodesulfobacteriota bacterium]HNU72032.1 selenocysteine-specific translation elongation factor [Thermodesulfobacteriota bacterium]HOC37810.1 selenocysteine-specific translation elongation factor [Thermodesulfobacteriota bacterium]
MSKITLGTAGHIDHGKTALIRALTGVDLDRLKEEKERGITIELGFGSLSLAPDEIIGIVDVPGHEKFIKRMVAGAGGIDIVMLVIAADDGVMPQTKEHLDICQLLGVKHGMVAITKADLVDHEWLDLVAADITELVQGTFLENAPLIPVSSMTGEGIPELIAAIRHAVRAVSPKSAEGPCFLPVDRVFTMKGFGTVVTGTMISGTISAGETLVVLPRGFSAKVRGVQVHGKPAERSLAGQRTAVNLQGVEKEMIVRGDVLTHPNTLTPTYRFDSQLTVLPHAPYPLKHGDRVRLHLFAATSVARIISYEENVLDRGGTYSVQFRLSDPLVAIPGARFVIRTIDASSTLGGGVLLDCHPLKHRRNDPATRSWFQALAKNDLEAIITGLARSSEARGVSRQEVLLRVNAAVHVVNEVWLRLIQSGTLIELDADSHLAVHQDILNKYAQKLLKAVQIFHSKNPLKSGIPLKEAQRQLGPGITPRLYDFLIHDLERQEMLMLQGDLIFQSGHEIALSGQQSEIKQKIETLLSSQELAPSSLNELSNQFSLPPAELLNLLAVSIKEGTLVKVKNDLYFSHESLNRLKADVVTFLKANKELTPGNFKEITGSSRKFAIPLLEYLDREKITIRVGDKRLLRKG